MTTGTVKPSSALDAIRPFRSRIGLTYSLIFVEDLLELAYPWATGLAIDGLMERQYGYIVPIIVAWSLRSAIGCFRQMYDTRLYTQVYNSIVISTILRQRSAGVRTSDVAARSGMSRDFVTFFEKDVPTILTSIVTIIGSAGILFFYDFVIGAITASLFLPVYFANRIFQRHSTRLNIGLNDQLEKEVDLIEAKDEAGIRHHFEELRCWRVKLSDAVAINWTLIEVLSIGVFLAVIFRATFLETTNTGDIFAILVYVWRLMENLDNVPDIVQQLTRLQDIRKRIEGGASIEAVGAELEKAYDEEAAKM